MRIFFLKFQSLTMEEMEQNFDSLFSADTKDLGDLQRQVVTRCVPPSGPSSHAGSRQGSRGGSGPGSRGSPARKPTMSTLCPSNPAVTDLQSGSGASRSHSMRDQTSHMREKYQTKYSQRRLSNKNSSPAPGLGSLSPGESAGGQVRGHGRSWLRPSPSRRAT